MHFYSPARIFRYAVLVISEYLNKIPFLNKLVKESDKTCKTSHNNISSDHDGFHYGPKLNDFQIIVQFFTQFTLLYLPLRASVVKMFGLILIYLHAKPFF